MKSILQHYKKATTYFVLIVALLAFTTSCQEEEIIVENPPPEESIEADSTLSNAMRMMANNEIEITTEDIDCIDFVYPISFSVYDSEFIIIDTVTINSAQELLVFLASLILNPNEIVSLNYPVSLEKADGTIVEANNNAELLTIIITALMECDAIVDPMNDCPPLLVSANLQQCFWYPKVYDGNSQYQYNHFTFLNDSVYRMTTFGYEVERKYDTYEFDNKSFIKFRANQVPLLDFITGEWEVLECAEGELLLKNTETNIETDFIKDCDLDLASCFGSGQGICDDDNDGFVEVDFNAIANQANCPGFENYTITFYLTLMDAENQTNPLPSPFMTTVPDTQQFYYTIVENATGELKYVSVYQIDAEDCGTGCDNPGILTEDLIIYMPFGNEVHELVSDQFLSGGGQLVTDRIGSSNCAIGFFENDDPIIIPITNDNLISQGDSFSVSLWFKMQNDNLGDLEIMFSKGSGINEGFQLAVFDLNTPLFSDRTNGYGLWDNDWNQGVDIDPLNQDWHNLTVTVDESNTVRLYRDGQLKNIDENSNIDIGPDTVDGYYLNTQNFRGHLDDLRVYKRALSPNEIVTLVGLNGDCNTCLD
ncbi:MAG: LamG domain-containing protein [Patiriisocius sp.]|uniref:LamG domain-containing protein n=1 Tax=Patiriisocius sp. TaxID=2822396 RepID=UPI003EFA5CFD